jgi:hypothetical protein
MTLSRGRFVGPLAVTVGALGLMIAAPATTAWARGDRWEPLPFPSYDASCGSTIVHVSAPVNNEYGRTTDLPGGVTRTQVTGRLVLNYSTDAGRSVTVNASGPGNLYVYPNGDTQIVSHGLNSFTFSEDQAATLGIPQISVSAGPMDVTFHADGTVSGHTGNIIQDVCTEIT